ncbi:MAG: YkgJ family cysteine cluster protein [Nitrospirae bacterium]|nr:MAG: YkgJ family cysteine cluster protein [Nitrospirota bacterium]
MKKTKDFQRFSFPDDEKKLPWLPLLLDAYEVIDRGLVDAVKEHEKKQKAKLACQKGCDVCCRAQNDIPIYPLEMVGIYWYAVEKIGQPLRETLKKQLLLHAKGPRCPFLIEHACTVHPVRPAACRQFNVFNKPCAEGEDPYYTRRYDVLTPKRKYRDRAFSIMLPFYGITDDAAKSHAIKSGLLDSQAKPMRICSWRQLAQRMDDFDFNPK